MKEEIRDYFKKFGPTVYLGKLILLRAGLAPYQREQFDLCVSELKEAGVIVRIESERSFEIQFIYKGLFRSS